MTRILILVEDDEHKAKAVIRVARRAGFDPIHHFVTRNDAAEKMQEIYKENPCVLTDWSFPIMHGVRICEDAGSSIVALCKANDLTVRVFSGRDVPAEGYEDIWFDAASVNGLQAWLEEEAKKV